MLAGGLQRPERIVDLISAGVIAIALIAMAGWQFGSVPMTSVIVGSIALQPTTAVALTIGGVGLAAGAHGLRLASRAAAVLLLLACVAWLSAYGLQRSVPTDLLLYRAQVLAQHPAPIWPGRPSLLTCVVVGMFAISLLGVGQREPRARLMAVTAASLGALLASLSILPFLLQDPTKLQILHQNLRIALNTAIAVGGLCVGVLILKRDTGWVRLVAGGGERGRIARLLTPVALTPVAIGALANLGVLGGYYGPDVRMLMIIEISVCTLLFLAFWAAQTLGRERGKRDSLARAMERSTVIVVDASGRITHWPPACEALYGWTAADALGRRPVEFLRADGVATRDVIAAALEERGEWRGEAQHLTKSGETLWVAIQWVKQDLVGEAESQIVATISDITELKRMETDAREDQERLKLAVEAYDLGIADADIANRSFVADAGFERLLGLPPGGLENSLDKLNAMVVESNPDRDVDIANHKPQQFDDVRMRRADGELRDFHGVRRFFYSPEGAHVRTIGIYRDVTEQLRDEAARRESQERLALTVKAYNLGVCDIDIANDTIHADDGLERMFGLAPGAMNGPVAALRGTPVGEDLAAAQRLSAPAIAAGLPSLIDNLQIHRSDGEVRDVHGARRFFYSPQGAHVRTVGIYRDVTEERQAQRDLAERGDRLAELRAELTHVARLSAMGEMAAGLAHEINQPLTAIGNSVGALKLMLGDGETPLDATTRARVIRAANQAESQAVRAGEIIRRLRDFISRGDADARDEALAPLIEDAVALGAPSAKADGIEMCFELSPKADRVLADRIQIQQVLVNLVRNATEAMRTAPGPHRLTVSTRAQRGMVEVAVRDNGPGIAAEIAAELFSPFRSTKSDGMGVGLSICRRIIEAHGGSLWLEASDLGADFRFTIPLASKERRHA